MVQIKMFNLYLVIVIAFLLFNSCNNIQLVDCSECYSDEPEWGTITVKVTINGQNQQVPITIYRGNIDDSVIEYIDTAYNSEYTIDVPVNNFYSVSAKYIVGNDTILAVDGGKIKTRKNTTDCDQECFEIKGGSFNCRLKYD